MLEVAALRSGLFILLFQSKPSSRKTFLSNKIITVHLPILSQSKPYFSCLLDYVDLLATDEVLALRLKRTWWKHFKPRVRYCFQWRHTPLLQICVQETIFLNETFSANPARILSLLRLINTWLRESILDNLLQLDGFQRQRTDQEPETAWKTKGGRLCT